MKVVQVLTYVSADGAFGGPLAVAVAQCAELARRGHDVEIVAGWDGVARLEVPGVRVTLLPVRRLSRHGFSGLLSVALLRRIRPLTRTADVVHVHLGRDLVTLPAAWLCLLGRSRRLVVQTHGMVKPDPRPAAAVVDVVTRHVLSRAAGVLVLNAVDAERVQAVAGRPLPLELLPNGVPASTSAPSTEPPEFVFLGRLHARKRVLMFAEAARLAAAGGVRADFTVIGPDEGDLPALEELLAGPGSGTGLRYEGVLAPGQAPDRLRGSYVHVLPSLDEPFPMTVLEALSVGVPSVVSPTCHVADQLQAADAAEVFDDTAEGLAAVMAALAADPDRRARLSANALQAVRTTFGVASVVDRLEQVYTAGPTEPATSSSSATSTQIRATR